MPIARPDRKRSLFVTATLPLLLALIATAALAEETGARAWEQIRRDDGITTWRRERPGQELATFRARSEMQARLWDLLAVLEDVNRASEWTANCEEMRRVARASDTSMLVYARMDAPWPVRDRDVSIAHARVNSSAWRAHRDSAATATRAPSARRTSRPPISGSHHIASSKPSQLSDGQPSLRLVCAAPASPRPHNPRCNRSNPKLGLLV